jgi:hypothetical protein
MGPSRSQSVALATVSHKFQALVDARAGEADMSILRVEVGRVIDWCSVFAGGFDLQSVCAVMGSGDDLATLDLLDTLKRKSLLAAEGLRGGPVLMLETIRQLPEDAGFGNGVETVHR